MTLNDTPITEQSNPKSINIDIQPLNIISEIISECEKEIFGGYENYNGLFEREIINKCLTISQSINIALSKHGSTNIILVGAGTSGRLCRLIAKLLKQEFGNNKINIIPIIAGGIKALIKAECNTEDCFNSGVEGYYQYTNNIDRMNCFLFGVSCGFSANYVNGAINANLKQSKYNSIFIGFNPIIQATINICEHSNLIIINPIVGPETIIGSVRMKGGTATMILLMAIISSGMSDKLKMPDIFNNIINNSKATLDYLHNKNEITAELMSYFANTLKNNGKIHLVGSSDFGALCIFDAAECPPTFGAFYDQVNGYTENGISDLVYYEYERKEILSKEINFENSFHNNANNIKFNDLVVFISDEKLQLSMINIVENCTCNNLIFIFLDEFENNENLKTNISERTSFIFNNNWVDQFQKILFVRSILLRLSTGGFILNGKVFENKMIDMRITNKKLFNRALRIISQITGFKETEIKESLLKIIYNGAPSQEFCLKECINIAALKPNVVPKTIVSLFYPEKSNQEIEIMLNKQPVIRRLIENELYKKTNNVVKLLK